MRISLATVTILLLFCISGLSQTSAKIGSMSLYEKDLVILGEGRKGPYLLPDSLIISNSEKVWINDNLLPNTEYELNAVDGEIRFIRSVSKGAKIRITYKRFPHAIRKSYFNRRLRKRLVGLPAASRRPIKPRPTPEEEFGAQLTKSGSLTRGVTVGTNRGLKVNSALNLNVSGKVAEDIEVVAALTDQSTPIQPEGTTQNLQEIDKVFVQIKAPKASATLGDYNLDLPETEFARYSRKLQGAMGKVTFDNFEFTASGAVSRGKYYSMQFMGQEGNQGPYQLKGDRGQIDIIVLAGTERVYIDGEPMVRGEKNDYVIDYASAQITFTRHRLITADSRIVVDFQYSDERFRRNIYSARGKFRIWDGKINIGTTYLRESDDKDNPLDFTLTDERLDCLQQAGDDPMSAVVDGASYMGEGKGRYVLEDGIYCYVGYGNGDYNVSFSDLGDGNGDYRYKGGGIYEYIGEKQGRYAPVMLLPTAHSHDIIGLDLDASPMSFLNIIGEVGLSRFDANTYSDLDDDDNNGLAQKWAVTLKPDSLKFIGLNLGHLVVSGKYRRIEDRFQDIDRTNIVEYNRKWDLPSAAKRGEDVRELTANYQPLRGLSFGGEFGEIEKGSGFASKRWQAQSSLNRKGWPTYKYCIEQIDKDDKANNRNGSWLRQRGHAEYKLWKLRPLFDYEGEVKEENWADSLHTGFKFDNYTGGLELALGQKLTASGKYSYRDDDDYVGADQYENKSTALTQTYKMSLRNIKSLTASLEFTHRERQFADPTISDKRTDLADLQVRFSLLKQMISLDWHYQFSNTATAQKERIYIKVSQGDGNYRFDPDLNEYVIDPLGDYIMRILTTDQFIPVVELRASQRGRFEPRRYLMPRGRNMKKEPGWLRKAISALSSETYIKVEERTQEKDVWEIYRLNFSRFRKPDVTIFGNLQMRQDVYLFENNRKHSLRLRYESRDELNNQYLEGGQDRTERNYSARFIFALSNKWSSKSEMIQKRTKRTFAVAGRQDRDVYSNQGNIQLSYRLRPAFELALQSRLAWEQDRYYDPPTRIQLLAFKPTVTYSLRGKGRLRAELDWARVNATPEGRVIPYEVAGGRSLGTSMRWDVRFDYRISKTIQASLSYSGNHEPTRNRTIHTGRAQLTASFR